MTSTELQTQTHDAELLPTPDVTDDGLALLQRQAEAMGAAHKIATVLSGTGMVPQAYRGKPDDAAAAILYGAEVGLKPQQALQQVFVVHGQPSIYARTMVALLKAKGYRFETIESTDQAVTVRGTSPRGEVEESTWTVDRAKTAGYTSNKKYATDPQAMLYAKAASEVSRKLAPTSSSASSTPPRTSSSSSSPSAPPRSAPTGGVDSLPWSGRRRSLRRKRRPTRRSRRWRALAGARTLTSSTRC